MHFDTRAQESIGDLAADCSVLELELPCVFRTPKARRVRSTWTMRPPITSPGAKLRSSRAIPHHSCVIDLEHVRPKASPNLLIDTFQETHLLPIQFCRT